MKKHQIRKSSRQEAFHYNKALFLSSIIFWFASLLMVGFYSYETFFGIGILLLLPIAWISPPAGLAVYANIFYWFAVLFLLRNKKPKISLYLMVILALFTFTLREIPYGESGNMASVRIWGYGAFVWGFALILLIGAVKDRRQNYSALEILLPYFSVFLAIISATLFYKNYQWKHANTDERQRYFPKFSAFAPGFKPSGIEYRPPPTHLPNNHLPVEISPDRDVELGVFNSEFKIEKYFYLPESFIYKGYQISRPYQDSNTYIIEKSSIQAAYRYDVVKIKDNQARQSIFDIQQNKEIWYSDVNLNQSKIYPDFNFEIKKLFGQSLPKEQDIKVTLPTTGKWTSSCSIQPIPADAMFLLYSLKKNKYDKYDETQIRENFIYLDNKIIELDQNNTSHLYCNADVILELNIGQSEVRSKFYHRNTLISPYQFEFEFRLTDNPFPPELQKLYDKYKGDSAKKIQSIELTEQGLLLKHEFGETLLLNQKK